MKTIMKEYRTCEACAHKNDVAALVCARCGEDISFVMISEEEEAPAIPENGGGRSPGADPPGPRRVKICEVCGQVNDLGLMECEGCGGDISFIRARVLEESPPATPAPMPPPAPSAQGRRNTAPASVQPDRTRPTAIMKRLALISVLDGHRIAVPHEGGDMGREGIGAAYLDRSDYVSRKHANLACMGDTWVMTVLGSNPTLVNGRPVPRGERCSLAHDDVVRLADMEFRVELS